MKQSNEEIDDVIIIGGGITGLSAAYIAAKEGKKVTVIDAGNKFGGLLNTFEIGNNKLECYYHHFFTHDKELNWLIKELKIDDKLFFKKTSMGVFSNGKIYNFNSIVDIFKFKPIKFFDKIKFGLTSVFLGKFADWKKYENISCFEWFKKWSGKSTTSSLWTPMLKVKFGPFAKDVPLTWMIGRLKQRMNSRKSGDERLGYLEGSLQILLDSLLEKLSEMGVKLINNEPLFKVNFDENKINTVSTKNLTISGKKFLFTIPGTYLSEILKTDHPNLSNQLSEIKYFGAICVILELNKPLTNVYWLNIADENFPFGGIIEHTNFIEKSNYNNSHIVYLSRYFAMQEDISKMENKDVENLMLDQLPKINPSFNQDWIKNVFIFKTNTAATVCDLNFSKKVPKCQTNIENMYIANMSHVYPDERSTNNSIKIAIEACKIMGIPTNYVNNTNSLSAQIGF
jgi:protoporphyrinogen oxidase